MYIKSQQKCQMYFVFSVGALLTSNIINVISHGILFTRIYLQFIQHAFRKKCHVVGKKNKKDRLLLRRYAIIIIWMIKYFELSAKSISNQSQNNVVATKLCYRIIGFEIYEEFIVNRWHLSILCFVEFWAKVFLWSYFKYYQFEYTHIYRVYFGKLTKFHNSIWMKFCLLFFAVVYMFLVFCLSFKLYSP